MSKKGILQEALADAKSLRQAAIHNASNSLAGHFKEALEGMVENQLNEEDDMDAGDEREDEDSLEESTLEHDPMGDVMSEMEDDDDLDMVEDEDELDLDLEGEDEDMEDDDDLDETAGFSEADLQEAIQEILDEVDHGDLGEPDDLDPHTHSTGLMDDDMKEAGWEEKSAPHSRDWTVKETKYRRTIAKLVAENKAYKKSNQKLKEAVEETNLFNRKLFYVHKLVKPGLSESVRKKIIKQLDKATSAQEAEGIYEALKLAVGVISEGQKSKKRSRKAPTLSEALGSQGRKERGVSHVDDAHLLNEDAKYSPHRMQVLAGLVSEE